MSDIVLVALITSVPALLTFILAVVNVFTSRTIHTLVNSNLSRVQADLVVAEARIVVLEDIIMKHA